MLMVPRVTQPRPFRFTHWPLTVERIVRPPAGVAVFVGVGNQPGHHLRWRKVPQPVLGEVLAGGCISHSACRIGLMQRHSRTLPLRSQPFRAGQGAALGRKIQFATIERAYFGNRRESADRGAVHVSCDMPDTLVPHDGLNVLPAVGGEQGMHGRPSDLGIPEPQGRSRLGAQRPSRNVFSVPSVQALGDSRVPGKAADSVCPVRNDQIRRRPLVIYVLGSALVQ